MIGDYSGTISSGYVEPFNDGVILGLLYGSILSFPANTGGKSLKRFRI